jgi:hypothetical protein
LADQKNTSLDACVDEIEEAYEFMLAYAAQGRDIDDDSNDAADVRKYLTSAATAIRALSAAVTSAAAATGASDPAMAEFVELLDSDIRASCAAVDLVLAQPAISSEIVDNLNASIHLRALLTNMFLIDSILKARS